MVFREKPHTASEFEAFITLLENVERRFELIHGEIVEKVPTQLPAAIVYLISGYLFMYLLKNSVGRTLVEARYQLPGDDRNARLPNLTVEVQFPDDTLKEMSDKAAYYLANGSKMVWLVYPAKKIVEVLTPTERQILMDYLEGVNFCRGFRSVSGIFFRTNLYPQRPDFPAP